MVNDYHIGQRSYRTFLPVVETSIVSFIWILVRLELLFPCFGLPKWLVPAVMTHNRIFVQIFVWVFLKFQTYKVQGKVSLCLPCKQSHQLSRHSPNHRDWFVFGWKLICRHLVKQDRLERMCLNWVCSEEYLTLQYCFLFIQISKQDLYIISRILVFS